MTSSVTRTRGTKERSSSAVEHESCIIGPVTLSHVWTLIVSEQSWDHAIDRRPLTCREVELFLAEAGLPQRYKCNTPREWWVFFLPTERPREQLLGQDEWVDRQLLRAKQTVFSRPLWSLATCVVLALSMCCRSSTFHENLIMKVWPFPWEAWPTRDDQ